MSVEAACVTTGLGGTTGARNTSVAAPAAAAGCPTWLPHTEHQRSPGDRGSLQEVQRNAAWSIVGGRFDITVFWPAMTVFCPVITVWFGLIIVFWSKPSAGRRFCARPARTWKVAALAMKSRAVPSRGMLRREVS